MKSLILLGIVVGSLAVHMKVGVSEVSLEHHHKHKRHHSLQQNAGQNPITNEEKKYLTDQQIHTNITYGNKPWKQVLDTTSYVSWFYSQHPQTQVPIVNGPTNAVSFQCGGDCVVSSTAEQTVDAHAGRITANYEIA
jgi:hypothetical protein